MTNEPMSLAGLHSLGFIEVEKNCYVNPLYSNKVVFFGINEEVFEVDSSPLQFGISMPVYLLMHVEPGSIEPKLVCMLKTIGQLQEHKT